MNFFKLSEAASIALHSCIYLSRNTDRTVTSQEISQTLHSSKDHTDKVMQRLTKAGVIKTKRGPAGGYQLAKDLDKLSMLEVYEAIEGDISQVECPLNMAFCGGHGCIMGDLFVSIQNQVRDYLENTSMQKLSESVWIGGVKWQSEK
ncbi:MAG TPA: Rrf2 family transcriptional regulator [Caldisericia bacterium]|nr:Rrf2 family transcriptional regulator [Caldisericia bacterium]HPF48418.1 Rrf2 family transcriptional regulator [Caldisericia bacterium]HPI83402.1 Rrf2 family transcriptional regulator [Caldisericia bacterium]HPQ92872.1 Rrf2 family transcriptional regulator [Caldisericia bacterium]HRV74030.1 Rrf2 family transcriptional regulator [Caldisericia bacterium]